MLEQEVAKHAASEELLRRSEATLSRYALSLERRNKDVRDFAYVMSHDLREPLVTVQGFAGELRHAIRELVTIAARAAGAVNPVDRARSNGSRRE